VNGPCEVLVFARAPVAGRAKTRLVPALGAEGAAQLAERMLQHAVDEACAADIGPVRLCGTPDTAHPAFVRLAQGRGVALSPQVGEDLGARMDHALTQSLRSHACALLIGSDVPALDAGVLRAARDALAMHDAVFVPTFDGGYALVGLRAPAPRLFDAMAWSTPQVMAETRRRLAALRLRHHELPTLADIDEPADLVDLPPGWTTP
jgi:rSAM/selenodomain-associated transferase 1